MTYSIAERVEIISLFFKNDESAITTVNLFNEEHPDKRLNHPYVLQLVRKFRETGSVANKKRNTTQNEVREISALGHVTMDPTLSTRKVADISGVSRTSVQRILKKNKFHPYKISLLQELNEDDYDRRLQFCETISERINNNPNFLFNVCFSDECTFFLNGKVNRHNCRYWSDSNPRLFHQTQTQEPEKLNVWAGIYGDRIVGPFFLHGNLTGEMYLDLLENYVDPVLTEIIENNEHYLEDEIIFQQDGAPPHFALPVRQFLDRTFPGRWIGRRGAIEWPPRSPDLAPLDFFLWGHLKSIIYSTQPESLEDLRQRIIDECRKITPEMLQNVRQRIEENLYYCMEASGAHFEHLIK